MSIKCGKCQATHESVAQVRACYGSQASKPGHRTNKYAGTCIRCGCTVAPEAGILSRSPGVGSQRLGQGDWIVQHVNNDDCDEAKLLSDIKDMQPKRTVRVVGPTARDFKAVAQGYYATKSTSGNNDLDFWFVRIQKDGRYAGFRSVSRVLGGRGTQRIRGGEQVAALRAILAAGTDAAGKLFASELGRCRKCGRDLTDDTSRELGIGPVCRAA